MQPDCPIELLVHGRLKIDHKVKVNCPNCQLIKTFRREAISNKNGHWHQVSCHSEWIKMRLPCTMCTTYRLPTANLDDIW